MESFFGKLFANTATYLVTAVVLPPIIAWVVAKIPSVRAYLGERPWAIAALAGGVTGTMGAALLALVLLQPRDTSAGLPRGAVVAFTKPCSQGWTKYGDASGRFILGQNDDRRHGLENRPANIGAGNETIALKSSNLPAHRHKGTTDEAVGKVTTVIGTRATGGVIEWTTRYVQDETSIDTRSTPQPRDLAKHAHSFTTDDGHAADGPLKVDPVKIDIMPPYITLYYCYQAE